MQVVHGSSAKKKPMQVVEEGKEEKLEEFNAEEALENLENINQEPEEATDAVEEEPQEAKEDVEEEKEETEEVEAKSSDEEEEESPKKKSRLQRRIDELVKKASVYEQERNQYYGRAQQLEEELKKKSTLNNDYDKLQKTYYDTKLESANKLLDKARLEHKSAYESGDSDRMLDAAESIADAKVELKTLESQKHLFDKEPEPVPSYPSVQAPQPVQQQQQPAQQPDPRALQWAQSNKWFGENAAMTGAAYAIDAQLKMEGFNPSSEDYYSELDRRIGESFPAKTAKAKPKQVVAGVTRAQSASKRVALTKSQVAMANKLGVPPSEYAKFVRNTND
jgi:hypothetical protein|tara:strand:+ start:366 stop:1370 length:1005 start_codon:yes stop_codon:yes gene_type:complete